MGFLEQGSTKILGDSSRPLGEASMENYGSEITVVENLTEKIWDPHGRIQLRYTSSRFWKAFSLISNTINKCLVDKYEEEKYCFGLKTGRARS